MVLCVHSGDPGAQSWPQMPNVLGLIFADFPRSELSQNFMKGILCLHCGSECTLHYHQVPCPTSYSHLGRFFFFSLLHNLQESVWLEA